MCKDSAITDVYVGHTTNFVQRKHAHRRNCINPNSANKKLKLYEVIRANGGWDNWKMEIINFFDCKDQSEARQKEQEYFISLNATLNSTEPFPKPKVKLSNVDKKHTELTAKKFNCELCNFTSDNKKNYTLHLRTKKHLECKKSDKQQSTYICTQCQKQYYSRNGLWKHAKKCVVIPIDNTVVIPETQNTSSNEITVLTNLVLEVVKTNNELQKQINDLLYKNNNLTI
jgi:hypothetical protein